MSDKVKVQEIAEEVGSTSKEIIQKAQELGFELKAASSTVTVEEAEEIASYLMTGESKLLKPKKETKATKIKKETVEKEELKEPKKSEPKIEEASDDEDIETIKPAKTQDKNEDSGKTTNEDIPADEKGSQETSPLKEEKPKERVIEPSELKKNETTSIDDKIMPKRRGLKIVKKLKPRAKEDTTVAPSKTQRKSLSELLGNASLQEDIEKTKTTRVKKDKKKKATAKSHEHGVKLDVDVSGGDFSSSTDSLLGEEVVLLDMGLDETPKMLEELSTNQANKKENQTNNSARSSRPSTFGNQPQGLKRGKRKKRIKQIKNDEPITSITVPEEVRVYEFAAKAGKSISEVMSVLFSLGMLVTKNDFLENDAIEILSEEFGLEVTIKDELQDVNYMSMYDDENSGQEKDDRPPVITIMGHVDHGKTSLLDYIRNSNITAKEAGGITQHIGAYTINKNGKEITFLDTPGHEAFSAMRARGAEITDIIIIVVAADDGVKPQTKEAIAHAKSSGCPILVAMNKIDKPDANIDLVKGQMAENDLTPVDWGGDIDFIPLSAKTGEGIDELLENILIQSEVLELKANKDAYAKAAVVEAGVEKGRGPVATVVVQNGTLRVGDHIVADTTFGRVKAINDHTGKAIKELGLSQSGQVVGLDEVPVAGSLLIAQPSEKEAKAIATRRRDHARAKELSKSTKVSLDELSGMIAEGKIKNLPIIIKADVAGSLEAIKGSLEKIKNDEVKVNIIHSGVGGITEADLSLAGTSDNSIILGFNVRPTGSIKNKAKSEGVEIKTYSIIYDLIDDIKDALSGMMSAIVTEENTGQAEVRDTFVVPKVGTVAGCFVTDGKVVRGGLARLIRDGVVVYTGKIDSLKRFKDDAKEVANGYECGIMFEKYNDIKVGDYIETFIEVEEKASIDID
jgi:translation initiation factor IF-2